MNEASSDSFQLQSEIFLHRPAMALLQGFASLPVPPALRRASCSTRSRLAPRPCSLRRQSRLGAAADQESGDAALTGEWPVNWSLASYEDVGEFFQQQMFKDSASPGTTLKDVMATSLTTITPDAKKEDIKGMFQEVRGPGCRAMRLRAACRVQEASQAQQSCSWSVTACSTAADSAGRSA